MNRAAFATRPPLLFAGSFVCDRGRAFMNGMFRFAFGCFRSMAYAAAGVLGGGLRVPSGGFHILFGILRVSGKGQRRHQEGRDHEFCGEFCHAF